MPRPEKHFHIISIALSLAILFVLTFAMLAPSEAIEFDPGSNYQKTLNLPSTDARSLAINIIQYALGFLGLVAVAMIIMGGFMWMTSSGNEQRVTKGKEIIKWAVVGLMVVLLSWAIVVFVYSGITSTL